MLTQARAAARALSQHAGPPELFLPALTEAVRSTLDSPGVLLLTEADEGVRVVHAAGPAAKPDQPWCRWAAEQAKAVLASRAEATLNDPNGAGRVLYLPVEGSAGPPLALAVLTDRATPDTTAQMLAGSLICAAAPVYTSRQSVSVLQARSEAIGRAMEVLAVVNRAAKFREAALGFVNEIANRWGAERASLGVVSRGHMKLSAVSGAEQITRKTDYAQAVEAAMQEAADQQAEVVHPPPEGADVVARAARHLASMHGNAQAVALPVRDEADAEPRAALVIEKDSENPLPLTQLASLRLTCELCGPALLRMHDRDRWIGAKLARATRDTAAAAVGPKHTWLKLIVLGVAALAVFLIFAHGMYKVEGSFQIEATQLQIIDAPYTGVLEAVAVEPGDEVVADKTVLAQLRTTELKLQVAELRADLGRFEREADLAMREGRTADQAIALAQRDQIAAQIQRVQSDLDRAELTSSLGGVVLSGDLKRRIGGQVERGDALFEVAPIEGLRAVIYVPEGQIADVTVGQRGELAAAANPGVYVGFTVESIEPAARVVEQQNVFAVRVTLDRVPDWARPGMEGVAKIDVERKRLAYIWTRSALDWVRMRLWY